MKFLLLYASTEGQTRKVMRFVADRLIEAGHSVELLAAADAEDLDMTRFDAAIVAGSVHMGRYQKALVKAVRRAVDGLSSVPTLFLSVSLAAAGDDAEDHAELAAGVDRLIAKTGWTPGRVEHIAGAFRISEYDFFKAWMMRRIAAAKGRTVDPNADTEFTDWEALRKLIAAWARAPGAA